MVDSLKRQSLRGAFRLNLYVPVPPRPEPPSLRPSGDAELDFPHSCPDEHAMGQKVSPAAISRSPCIRPSHALVATEFINVPAMNREWVIPAALPNGPWSLDASQRKMRKVELRPNHDIVGRSCHTCSSIGSATSQDSGRSPDGRSDCTVGAHSARAVADAASPRARISSARRVSRSPDRRAPSSAPDRCSQSPCA